MEVLGAVASSIALIQAASKGTELAARAAYCLRDAPHELEGLRDKITSLEAQLSQMTALQISTPMSISVLESFQKALDANEKVVRLVLDEITRVSQKSPGFRCNIKWALLSRRVVEGLEKRLQESQYMLTIQLLLLNTRLYDETKRLQLEAAAYQSQTLLALDRIEQVLSRMDKPSELGQQKLLNGPKGSLRPPTLALPLRRNWPRTIQRKAQLGAILLFLGFRGAILRQESTNGSTILVSMRFRLRLSWLSRDKVIVTEFRFPRNHFFSIPRFNARIFNVVSEDGDMMVACKQGDPIKVRILLRDRKASVFDVTPSNYTPLYYAILSGSVELVQLLLDQHRDLSNCPFGTNNTSPLQMALHYRRLRITRLLLNHEAVLDYVSSIGWTPIFYLAIPQPGRNDQQNSHYGDLFNMLSSDSGFLDLEVQDLSGYTILQHVAAYGTGDTVRALIALGANLPVLWFGSNSPMDHAISHGNLSTFQALLQYYPDLEQTDKEGYTMLAYAAWYGSDGIVRHLLSLGAIDVLFQDDDNPEIDGPTLGPTEYAQYMQALQDYGRVAIREEKVDEGIQTVVYWNANEENEWFEA